MSGTENKPSIKKNYVFNTIYTLLNMLFPLVTFPYVSRILGPEGIGKVNFAFSFVNYFYMFMMIVNPIYAIREIAKARDDKAKLDKVFSELFSFNLIALGVVMVAYTVAFLFVAKMQADFTLYLLAGLYLLLMAFNIDWLFQGMENYKFLMIRHLVVKAASLAMIFLLVRKPEDYNAYMGITIIVLGGANILNIAIAGKYAKFSFKKVDLGKHLKNLSLFFIITIVSMIGTNMDKLLLGFMLNDEIVGYYALADKMILMSVSFTASLNSVLLPRVSYHFANNQMDEFQSGIRKTFYFILLISLPLCAAVALLSKEIVMIFGGDKYLNSIDVLRILSLNVIVTGLLNLGAYQLLCSTGQEKKYFISLVIAIPALAIMLPIGIHFYGALGAAVAVVLSNVIQLIVQFIFGRSMLKPVVQLKPILAIVFATAVMGVLVYFMQVYIVLPVLIKFGVIAAAGMGVYFGLLLLLRNDIMMEIWNIGLRFIRRKLHREGDTGGKG